ncbi:hypothetical protein PCG10_010115 [Penicillium crustosum]|uniref:Clr5 domain-containing protein n=2 Tax=Penicillium TaxID=5073 RepID=A0A9P5GF13_PENCR|nr:hypothetical protein PCG10_010115 [Penicillium crustosum]
MPTKWATEADWTKYRDTIISLYRQKSLAEVMEHMQQEHQFRATVRMYKGRLKAWCVGKYTKRSTDKIPASEDDATVFRTSRRPMPSVEPALGAPGSQQKVLDCLKILEKYINVNSAGRRWKVSTTFMASLQHSDWLAQITTVTIFFKGGRLQDGFRLLGNCFEACKTNLKAESPMLTSEIFMGAFQLFTINPSLGWSFLKYIRDLSGIVLEMAHPLFLLLSKYLTLDKEAFANCSDVFLGCFLDLMARCVPGWDESHHGALLLTTGRIFLLSLIGFSQYEELTRKSKNNETMPLLSGQQILQYQGELPPAATRSDTLSLYSVFPARIKVVEKWGGIAYLSFDVL